MNVENRFNRHLLEKVFSNVLSVTEYIIIAGNGAFDFIMEQQEARTATDLEGREHYLFNNTEVINNPMAADGAVWVVRKTEYPVFFELEEEQ